MNQQLKIDASNAVHRRLHRRETIALLLILILCIIAILVGCDYELGTHDGGLDGREYSRVAWNELG